MELKTEALGIGNEVPTDPFVMVKGENKELMRLTKEGDVIINGKKIDIDKEGNKIVKAFSEMIVANPLNFTSYQKMAHTTALYLDGVKKENPQLGSNILDMLAISYVGLGLGEAGEVQNKLKKIIRDKNGIITDEVKIDIKKELGDILWYVAEMSTILGLDMTDVAQANINKLFKRKDEGKLQGSGDNR